MRDEARPTVTEADWQHQRVRTQRLEHVLMAIAGLIVPGLSVPALVLTDHSVSGTARYPVIGGWMLVLLVPVIYVMFKANRGQQHKSDETASQLARQLTEAAADAALEVASRELLTHRQKFESRIANALDMAEGEPEVIGVIERSFESMLPDAPIELLLADNSHAHLLRMAFASPTGVPPGCGVDSPDHCPAARRAQVQRFSDSAELDACPKLVGRLEGVISATCVPVSIMGRTVGVIHVTGEQHTELSEEKVADLETLAKLAGSRIGLLRVMAETLLQAETDSLTGLLNRRAFEEQVAAIRRGKTGLSLAIADLDHFKLLNDAHGHETGDRALRLFAQVVRESVRSEDVVGRHGGEEFVIALPGCTGEDARAILEGVAARLQAAITVAGLPLFTVSFGLTEATPHEELPSVIARADVALFQAKHQGRDQIVLHDGSGRMVAPQRGPVDAPVGTDDRLFGRAGTPDVAHSATS